MASPVVKPERPAANLEGSVKVIHRPSGMQWTVPLPALVGCSPVFVRMFAGGPFREALEREVEISDFPLDAVSQFVDLLRYPSIESVTLQFLMATHDCAKVLPILEKYDARGLIRFLLDL
eukprot:EG_transcript_50631